MSRILIKLFTWLYDFIHKPLKVLIVCLAFMFIQLILGGTFFQLWSLNNEKQEVAKKITLLNAKNSELDMKIKQISDPNFLEFEIRNQFDFVEKGDLVFIFSDSN